MKALKQLELRDSGNVEQRAIDRADGPRNSGSLQTLRGSLSDTLSIENGKVFMFSLNVFLAVHLHDNLKTLWKRAYTEKNGTVIVSV